MIPAENQFSDRFCFYTDVHLNPQKQYAWFVPTKEFRYHWEYQISRLEKMLDFCKEYGVTSVVCGGDLFDFYSSYDGKLLSRLVDLYKRYDFKYYFVIGNHDVFKGNLNDYYYSVLRFFVDLLGDNALITSREDIGLLHWSVEENKIIQSGEEYSSKFKFLFSHSTVASACSEWAISYEDVKIKDALYFLAGDQHNGFGPKLIGNTIYCNPGAFTLQNIDELDRVPNILLFDQSGYVLVPFEYDSSFIRSIEKIDDKIFKHYSGSAKGSSTSDKKRVSIEEALELANKQCKLNTTLVSEIKKDLENVG